MSTSPRGIERIWPDRGPLVGMVHLLPLPGSPRWGGSMDAVLERATRDARALAEAGFDAALVENYGDVPFLAGAVPAEAVAALARATDAVCRSVAIPVGVNVLRNDARAAVGIATATGARFVRVNVHTGSMWTDQGLLEGRAGETLRTKAALGAEVAILADVHVKHAVPPVGSTLEEAASDAWHRGLADALVVSGTATGAPTSVTDVARVREVVPSAPVLVGSGADADSIVAILAAADGAIVGSAVMNGGRAGNGVDPRRAEALVRAARRGS